MAVLAWCDARRFLKGHGEFGRAIVSDEGANLGDLAVGLSEQFRGELHPHGTHIRRRGGAVDALEALLESREGHASVLRRLFDRDAFGEIGHHEVVRFLDASDLRARVVFRSPGMGAGVYRIQEEKQLERFDLTVRLSHLHGREVELRSDVARLLAGVQQKRPSLTAEPPLHLEKVDGEAGKRLRYRGGREREVEGYGNSPVPARGKDELPGMARPVVDFEVARGDVRVRPAGHGLFDPALPAPVYAQNIAVGREGGDATCHMEVVERDGNAREDLRETHFAETAVTFDAKHGFPRSRGQAHIRTQNRRRRRAEREREGGAVSVREDAFSPHAHRPATSFFGTPSSMTPSQQRLRNSRSCVTRTTAAPAPASLLTRRATSTI